MGECYVHFFVVLPAHTLGLTVPGLYVHLTEPPYVGDGLAFWVAAAIDTAEKVVHGFVKLSLNVEVTVFVLVPEVYRDFPVDTRVIVCVSLFSAGTTSEL